MFPAYKVALQSSLHLCFTSTLIERLSGANQEIKKKDLLKVSLKGSHTFVSQSTPDSGIR